MPVRIILISLIIAFGIRPGLARSEPMTCTNAPRSHWMSWQEIETLLSEQGQRLVRLRIGEDRCLAVLALDGKRGYKEMRIDPVSGKILHAAEVSEPNMTGSLPKPTKK